MKNSIYCVKKSHIKEIICYYYALLFHAQQQTNFFSQKVISHMRCYPFIIPVQLHKDNRIREATVFSFASRSAVKPCTTHTHWWVYYTAWHWLVSRVQRCLRTLSATIAEQPASNAATSISTVSVETFRLVIYCLQQATLHNMICNPSPTGLHILTYENTYFTSPLLFFFDKLAPDKCTASSSILPYNGEVMCSMNGVALLVSVGEKTNCAS